MVMHRNGLLGVWYVPTVVVYLDEFFLDNLAMNYLLLYTTAKLCRLPARPVRVLCAAGLGSIYAFVIFLPHFDQLWNLSGKILVSLVMTWLGISPPTIKKFATALALLYLVSFTAAGAVLAAAYFLAPASRVNKLWNVSEVLYAHLWLAALFAPVCLWLVNKLSTVMARCRMMVNMFKMSICIYLQGKKARVEAILDTGNHLEEPLSGRPVVVVELEALREILPEALIRSLGGQKEIDYDALLPSLMEAGLASRVSLIPFRALGQEKGMMVGFKPDMVEIGEGKEMVSIREVVIGIWHKRLGADLNYGALIHPRLLEETGLF